MSLQERYETEKAKWDDIAEKQFEKLRILGPSEDFHHHAMREILLTGVSEFLGDLRGKRVLEMGCGAGLMSTLLAKSGAHLTSFDLSSLSVRLTKQRAKINKVDIDTLISAGEYLPFADESFDIVFGKSILHHLDIPTGKGEVYRVLRKGNRAVFMEPMGMNPALTFMRQYMPYRHKGEVGVDQPLTYKDMDAWTHNFQFREYKEVQFLSMIERAFGWGRRFPVLRKLDEYLLKNIPMLRRFCRYVVIFAIK